MLVRFYEIMVDAIENGENTTKQLVEEFRLDIPSRDLSEAVERAEHISCMMETLTQHTGHEVTSFRYENAT